MPAPVSPLAFAAAVGSPAGPVAPRDVAALSIGEYLIARLQDYGLRDVFGIPGDYVLGFYSLLEHSPLRVVGCCREDNAGFAADAYARVRGLGAVCVTYCVGGLSLCNSIAGAYAEKSPVVVISGSPGLAERRNNPFLHHKVRDFRTQLEVFEKITAASAELNDPLTAFREIDRVLEVCVRAKRPVYIELPRDMVKVVPGLPHAPQIVEPTSDAEALAEALDETCRMLAACARPVILAGVEIHRFGLQDQLLAFAEGAGVPVAATILGKSVIRETHPLYVGLYEGAMSRDEVTQFVEESDCLLLLGSFMSDIDRGIDTANLDPRKCVYATSDLLRIGHHHFQGVLLGDFLAGLVGRRLRLPARPLPIRPQEGDGRGFVVRPEAPLSIARLMARLDEALDDRTIVIADVGDALFAGTELTTHGRTEFIGPAYYASMGFCVPAALGASVAAPEMRVIALVGDGAFQMTGNELSTIVRHGFPTIVIVLDNQGYGTERFLHPGDFNEIHPWHYHRLPEVFGGGTGYVARTEGEFDAALTKALADRRAMSLIQARLDPSDCSQALRRLAEKLSKRV